MLHGPGGGGPSLTASSLAQRHPPQSSSVPTESSKNSRRRAEIAALEIRGGSGGGDADGGDAAAAERTRTTTTTVLAARLSLLSVAFLFGTLNVSLRLLYSLPDPPAASVVGVCRGILTALCFLPAVPKLMETNAAAAATAAAAGGGGKEKPPSLWNDAAELAFWNVAAQGLLTVGLTMTSSSVRASFLAQTSVLITPLISKVAGQAVERSVWAGSALALAGLVILSTGGKAGGGGSASGNAVSAETALTGDLLVLSCAVCWSMYLFRFGAVADRHAKVRLQATTCAIRAGLYVAWFAVAAALRRSGGGGWEAVADMWRGWRDARAWGLLVFSAVGSGAVAGVLQQRGQAAVSASESNVILSSEPVFAGLCAWILLGELMSPRENFGGLLILQISERPAVLLY